MIGSAYVFTDEELGLIDDFKALPESKDSHKYWSHEELNSLRSNIKTHCILEQAYRCCYCNRENRTTHGRLWDVEHIVAKSSHVRFMFEIKNLAASCADCNNFKGDTNVLKNKAVINYPISGDRFKIIHAHFHEYSEHIQQVGNVYWGRTDEGKFTVYNCDLLRFAKQEGGVPDHVIDADIYNLVDAIFSGNQADAEIAIHNASILIKAKKT